MIVATRMDIAEALPRCFPLPDVIVLGSQKWRVTISALHLGTPGGQRAGDAAGVARLTLLLSGPYERYRHARIVLDVRALLDGAYEAAAAARAIARWLPHSDAGEVFEVPMRPSAPAAHFAHPAND